MRSWPSSECSCAPEEGSKIFTVASSEADARSLPLGENEIALTALEWPDKSLRTSPFAASATRTIESSPPIATLLAKETARNAEGAATLVIIFAEAGSQTIAD